METSRTDDTPPFLALMEQLKQALNRDLHLQLSPDNQLLAIHIMANAILRIRRNMNSLAPVHKLPTELLTLIFEYAILHDERMAFWNASRNPEDAVQPYCADIVQITHVCHQWRSAALTTPRMWTYIDSRFHGARMAAFMSRSQAVPLSLQLTGAHPSDVARLVRSCGHRLRRLDISEVRDELDLRSLQFDGSRLECVTISADIQEPESPLGHTGLRTELTAFERAISSLKGLAVYNYLGDWVPITHFPDLTHLFLRQYRQPPLHALTALLSNTPRLQVLHLASLSDISLDSDLPTDIDTTDISLRSVALPHLKLLACDFDLQPCIRLLALLEFPQEVCVFVGHDNYVPTEIFSEPCEVHSIEWLNSLTRLEVTIAGQSVRVVAEGHRSGLWIEGYHEPLELLHWLRPLKSVLGLRSICSLDFSAEPYEIRAESLLHDLLGQLPSLVTMRFLGQPRRPTLEHSEFRDISVYTPEAKLFLVLTPGEGEPVACPNLTTLYVEAEPGQLASLSPTITDMLAARANTGAPVKRLTLRVLQSTDAPRKRKRDTEPLELRLRTTFSTAAGYVEDLHLEFESTLAPTPDPREATGSMESGTLWDLSEETEKYWIVPMGQRPPWLEDSP